MAETAKRPVSELVKNDVSWSNLCDKREAKFQKIAPYHSLCYINKLTFFLCLY